MVYMGSKSKYAKSIVPILQRLINDNNIHTCKDKDNTDVSCDKPDTFLISINAMGKIWPATGSWDPQKSCEFEKDCELLKSPTKLSW